MTDILPARGEVWYADLGETRGREQAGNRPALIISIDGFNGGPAELVIVVPLTRTDRGIPYHVKVVPPEASLSATSFIKCEDIRSISKEWLCRRLGRVSVTTMLEVADNLQTLLGLWGAALTPPPLPRTCR